MPVPAEGRRIRIRGIVQGVGFRPWVYRVALDAGVAGRVRNDSSGVTIEAFGSGEALREFERGLHGTAPPAARIVDFDEAVIPPEGMAAFVIEPSAADADRRVSIPPDLATCPDCVRDIFDPANRRYRYAFTNCTNCGPRFTIATDVPYDRAATTMGAFAMCECCRREYEDVGDRRFHAQPTACPECGPRVWIVQLEPGLSGFAGADAIERAAAALRAGLIVAVKGIGGFHLACDATSEEAVRRLRARKRREEKPLAVMVRTLEEARALADIGAAEQELLLAPERPIVLVEKRAGGGLAGAVAPGNRQVGVLLAYSPLHHLLLADAGRPLVMTSGNLSEEPIAFVNDEAVDRLAGIADLALLHDRDIHTRCDDSVAAIVAGRPMLMRRSRGYVPRAIALTHAIGTPVLAAGALLKNTFCLAAGDRAYLGPHIGDLENPETYDAYTTAIARFQRFVDIRPELVACDLHPDYMSTIYARQLGTPVIEVQHHHAHVVAGMAEHHLEGPVIGVAYDGTGLGTDGTSWGSEIMLATPARFERLATFRPLRLVGGDRAVREPWRAALALLLDAYDGTLPPDAPELMPMVSPAELAAMTALLRGGVQVSLSHGMGRYFDAFGALFLRRRRAAFEGQVALAWNQAADPLVADVYPFDLDTAGEVMQVDLRPAVRAAVDASRAGTPVPAVAAAFHNTVAAATAAAVERIAGRAGRLPVVASGGCFQNVRLAESLCRALPGFEVKLHAQVPPGDGGLALGQAVVAAASRG